MPLLVDKLGSNVAQVREIREEGHVLNTGDGPQKAEDQATVVDRLYARN